jgi:hypothetical protein
MNDDKSRRGLATLSRDQLVDMMAEMADVQSVELKMNVAADQRMALSGLDFDPLAGRIRQVFFFDTPDLTLFRHGLVVRARRTQKRDDDTVVKIRPVTPSDLPPDIRSSKDLKIEMDMTRGAYVVSASLKGQRSAGAVQMALRGERELARLFTKQQRAFFADHVPHGVGWSDLIPLGPIIVLLVKFVPPGFSRKTTIEQWHYPGEVPLVEISTKATPQNAFQVLSESVELLGSLGLSATGRQEPKTRKALEFFSQPQTRAPARTGR